MKAFITLAIVCLAVSALAGAPKLTEEHKAKAKAIFKECIKQEHVSEEDVNKLKKRDFENSSKEVTCAAACLLEKYGVLKDNKIQEEVASKILTPIIGEEKTKEILHKCKDIKGDDRCDTARKISICLASLKDLLFA